MLAADLSRVVAMIADGGRRVRGLVAGDRLRRSPASWPSRRRRSGPRRRRCCRARAKSPEELTAANVDVDRDRERRHVRRAGAGRAAARGRRASAGSSSPTRSTLLWSAFFVVQLAPRSERPCRRHASGRASLARDRRRVSARSAPSATARVIVFLYFCADPRRGCAERAASSSPRSTCSTSATAGLGFLNAAMGVGGVDRRRPSPSRSSAGSGSRPTSASAWC